MNLKHVHRATALTFALVALVALTPLAQDAPTKPRLSEAIKQALDSGGAPAAERRFKEIYPAQKDKFEIDAMALMELGSAAMTAGDMATAQLLMQMGLTVMQDDPTLATLGAGRGSVRGAATAPEPTPSAPAGNAAVGLNLGPPRTDLARFYGRYGDHEVTRRGVFVRETCHGHLQLGALWGGAAPLAMRSESDLVFVQAFVPPYQETPAVRVEFTAGPDGKARTLAHSLLGEMQSVPRVGDLDADTPVRDCSPAGGGAR